MRINMLNQFLTEITYNNLGVEIGGPDATIIYKNATSIDNVIFQKIPFGLVIIRIIIIESYNDAVNILLVEDECYNEKRQLNCKNIFTRECANAPSLG
jgi:hypothetical protein